MTETKPSRQMKQKIPIVTGNPGKVRGLEAMGIGKLTFKMHDIDIPEIQSMDLHAIVEDKLMKAYAQIKGPVIVDDVSAGLDNLGGLPGPFIKFFNHLLGNDALYKLSKAKNERVTIICIYLYLFVSLLIMTVGKWYLEREP